MADITLEVRLYATGLIIQFPDNDIASLYLKRNSKSRLKFGTSARQVFMDSTINMHAVKGPNRVMFTFHDYKVVQAWNLDQLLGDSDWDTVHLPLI